MKTSPDVFPKGSASMSTNFPSVNGMGAQKPMTYGRDGTSGSGKLGEFKPAGVVAEGRFGGSRDMEGKVRKVSGGKRMTGRR